MEDLTPKLPRQALRIPLELRVHVTGPDGHETLLMSHDWSASGVFLRTRHPFPVSFTTKLSVLLPGAHAALACTGMVVRTVLEGDPAHNRPPGMALRFEHVPPALLAYLVDAARQHSVLKPESILTELPPLLVLGGERPERLRYSVFLDSHGFDVSAADTTDEAMALIDKGLDPVAYVIIDDGTNSVELHKRLMHHEGHHAPRALVLLGDPHGGFEGHLGHSMEVLPRHADVSAVKFALDQQLRSPPLLSEAMSETDGA